MGRPLLNENETNLNNTLFGNLEDPRLLETIHQFPTDNIPNLFGTPTAYTHGHPDLNLNHALSMFQQNGYNPGPLSAPAHTMSFPPHVHNPPAPAPQQQNQTPQMPQHHRPQSSTFIKPMQSSHLAMQQRRHAGQQRPTQEMLRRASSDYLPTINVGGDLYSHTTKEMLKEARDARPDSYLERRMTFTYGSDTGFKGNAYNPPKSVLTHTQQLEANKVGVVHAGYKVPPGLGRPASASGQEEPQSARSIALESIADESEQEHETSRKRRRIDRDDASDDDDQISGMSRKKSRPQLSMSIPPSSRTPNNGDTTPLTPGGKSSDPKPARVNLTEEEKKMNHIRSEQKRRNQIKEGFADLTDLMPDAASAGPSKCTILAKAVDWVSDLIEGNKKLREQLNSLTGSTGQ